MHFRNRKMGGNACCCDLHTVKPLLLSIPHIAQPLLLSIKCLHRLWARRGVGCTMFHGRAVFTYQLAFFLLFLWLLPSCRRRLSKRCGRRIAGLFVWRMHGLRMCYVHPRRSDRTSPSHFAIASPRLPPRPLQTNNTSFVKPKSNSMRCVYYSTTNTNNDFPWISRRWNPYRIQDITPIYKNNCNVCNNPPLRWRIPPWKEKPHPHL